MNIRFTNKKLQTITQDEKMMLEHVKGCGVDNPRKAVSAIELALSHIESAPTMYDIPAYFRPHALTTDRNGQYAMNITNTHRMILRPDHDDVPGFNWENMKSITHVVVLQLSKDYHKKKEKL